MHFFFSLLIHTVSDGLVAAQKHFGHFGSHADEQ